MDVKLKPQIELPPPEFSNAMNGLSKKFDFTNWRQSTEWLAYIAGYNAAVRESNRRVMAQYDMGTTREKLFKITI